MRRPAARILRFLAESREGLDRMIARETEGKQIVSIKKGLKEGYLFGAYTAEVRYKEAE